MFYDVFKLKDLVELKDSKMDKKVLLESQNSALRLIALKKDEIIDTHTAKSDSAVYVLDGEIELHFTAQQFKLDKGEILMFKRDEEHKVLAKKDSKFLVFCV